MNIQYIDLDTGRLEVEKVYGDKGVAWMYQTFLGRIFSNFLAKKWIAKLYGAYQNSSWSRGKILPFVENFGINLEHFLPDEAGTADTPYPSFNSFFIRKYRPGLRPFVSEETLMPAFSEARYFGWDALHDSISLPVKGQFLSAKTLLGDERWSKEFKGGPCFIARLCPVDYHRFHFPDNGKLVDFYTIDGAYHSVNPMALKVKPDILCTNERHISIIDSEHFGLLAYIEVGAMMVGKIVQTFKEPLFKRGDEKGYFLFGASTVIVIGQAKKWKPMRNIIENSSKGIETYVRLGSPIAEFNIN